MADETNAVFIYDYMGGWLDRGIPLYTRSLAMAFAESGWTVRIFRALRIQRHLPKFVNHMLGAFCEQIIAPIFWRCTGATVAIFPYNAMPLIDIFSKRAHIVIHDTMTFEFKSPLYTRLYYRVIYHFIRRARRPIFTVSGQEVARLREFGFVNNEIHVLPNGFGIFRNYVTSARNTLSQAEPRSRGILLCTGIAPTKDFLEVARTLLPLAISSGWRVEIFGLGSSRDVLSKHHPSIAAKVKLLGQLSDRQVAEAYVRNSVIWVHSLKEGFGRCVVEGRLAGRPVVCSDIPAFARIADRGVYLYTSSSEFLTALQRAEIDSVPTVYSGYDDIKALRNAINMISFGKKRR